MPAKANDHAGAPTENAFSARKIRAFSLRRHNGYGILRAVFAQNNAITT